MVIECLSEKNLSIAIAESCTGGYISSQFTSIPGASGTFEMGLICYSNKAKIELLGVNASEIEKNGAVSDVVAAQMAEKIRETSDVQIGISATGIAGPRGGTDKKPVGLVYIGISTPDKLIVEKELFQTDRTTYRKLVLNHIVCKLEEMLEI